MPILTFYSNDKVHSWLPICNTPRYLKRISALLAAARLPVQRYNIGVKKVALRRIRIPLGLAAQIIAAVIPCSATNPAPGERIISFAADITVREDASVEVREEFV